MSRNLAEGHDVRHLRQFSGVLALFFLATPIFAWPLIGANLPVGPCGPGVLHYDNRSWIVASAGSLTASSTPRFQGHGIVTHASDSTLTYLDFSGARVTLAPGSQAVVNGC